MSYRRFTQINAFFHAFDNNSLSKLNNEDRLIKVRPLIDFFLRKFNEVYTPDKQLSVDEGILAFKGRLSFKVYNKDKPNKYGIKLYILAESLTGYVSNYNVYVGYSQTSRQFINLSIW